MNTMPDRPLDIRERIERQTLADLADHLGLPTENVQRVAAETNEAHIPDTGPDAGKPPEVWLTVAFSDEDTIYPGSDFAGSEGVLGGETLILPFTIDAHLGAQPPDTPFNTWCNYWIARVKQAVMRNIQSEEGGPGSGGDELACNTRVAGTFGPTVSTGQRDIIVGVDAQKHYRHVEGDPYTLL